jgi:hypothetical protein
VLLAFTREASEKFVEGRAPVPFGKAMSVLTRARGFDRLIGLFVGAGHRTAFVRQDYSRLHSISIRLYAGDCGTPAPA